jgi:hypothetical protein
METDLKPDSQCPDPNGPPGGDSRRRFITRLGQMTFLTAAVLKFGVGPGFAQDPAPPPIDKNCGKPDPDGEGTFLEDSDCGKPGSNGDQDCGKNWGLGVHQDNDCVVSGGDGADNDCGKPELFGGVHQDNDCTEGGGDQDCGKLGWFDTPDGPTLKKHEDSDGQA